MEKLKMMHLPHDGRHIFSSLMDSAEASGVCIKLIMGHSMKNDTTKGMYTHRTLEELLTDMHKEKSHKHQSNRRFDLFTGLINIFIILEILD